MSSFNEINKEYENFKQYVLGMYLLMVLKIFYICRITLDFLNANMSGSLKKGTIKSMYQLGVFRP